MTKKTKTIYRLEYQFNQEALNQASLLDGIFPLVHNVLNLTEKEILETYNSTIKFLMLFGFRRIDF